MIASSSSAVHFDVRQLKTLSEAEKILSAFKPDVVLLSAPEACPPSTTNDLTSLGGVARARLGDVITDSIRRLKKSDRYLPIIVLVDGASSSVSLAMELLAQGATDCVAKPIVTSKLSTSIAAVIQSRRLQRSPAISNKSKQGWAVDNQLVGKCEAMLAVFRAIGIAAAHNHATLVIGEIGTGKTLVANLVHSHSRRRARKLKTIRCEELNADDFKTSFFADLTSNYETDHSSKETTWLLENIDRTPWAAQGRLVEWVREKNDASATEANVPQQAIVMTLEAPSHDSSRPPKTLRPELFFELRGGTIKLPPVRDRGGDIELLINHFVSQFMNHQPLDGGVNESVSGEVLRMLRTYHWPGNLTELRSVIRAALRHGGDVRIPSEFVRSLIQPARASNGATQTLMEDTEATSFARSASVQPMEKSHPNLQLRSPDYWTTTVDSLVQRALLPDGDGQVPAENSDLGLSTHAETVEALETGLITAVLRRTGGNLAQSARLLGMTRVSLRKKIHSLGLVIPGRGVSS